MNARVLLLVPLTPLLIPLLPAQSPGAEPPVPVTPAFSNSPQQALITRPAGEDQRVYGPQQSTLIAPDAAKALVDKFRAAYGQTNSPRLVIYVNRALAEDASGLRLAGRTEKYYETVTADKEGKPTTTTDRSGENTYTATEVPKPSLADQQTAREIERLFGRVFRNAGAKLADPKAAVALLADAPEMRIGGDQAVRERDALQQIADIAVEVLVSSRSLSVRSVSGDTVYTVPDIQVTAIRLSDSAIIGQAAASDVLGRGTETGRVVRQFGVADITEATAFALMEDMLTGTK